MNDNDLMPTYVTSLAKSTGCLENHFLDFFVKRPGVLAQRFLPSFAREKKAGGEKDRTCIRRH